MLGCAPLYLGYATLGTILFGGRSSNFGSVRASVVTLFSLLNGDSMLDVFVELHSPDVEGVIADLYLMTFCCLFIYCAVNVFISIIANSYQTLQENTEGGDGDDSTEAAMRWRRAAGGAQAAAVAVANPSFAAASGEGGGGGGGHSTDSSGSSVQFSTSGAGATTLRSTRQSVSERLVSGGLNLIGSIANTLAEEELLDGQAAQELDAGLATEAASSGGRDETGAAEPRSDAGADVWRRRCLEQRHIVDAARAELLVVLQGMDAQIAALDGT